jgi:hypothetical protein
MQELGDELGGIDGLYVVFGCHYMGMFANPRVHVLFDTGDESSAANALEHGKRIAATLLDQVHHTREYAKLGRGSSGAFVVMGTHAKAKKCSIDAPQEPASGHAKRASSRLAATAD